MQINQELIQQICQISRQAASCIMEIYKSDFIVNNKADNSPLTNADIAAHHTICSLLEKLTPDVPILSEESSDIPYSQYRRWSHYWLIDPLDGTRGFIKHNGEFTVNIAFIENHEPKLGVVYVPITDICYYAASQLGAFKKNADGTTEVIQTKTSAIDHITLASSRTHGHEKQQSLLNHFRNTKVITTGSSLKFCMVAEGSVDIYPRFGLTSEWDTAAAQCIVEEAGGSVVDMNFQPLRYNQKDSLLNPEFLVIADRSFNWQQYLNKIVH